MISRRFQSILGMILAALALWSACPETALGLSVTNYSAAANNRFASGYSYPVTAVVSNTSSSFVGLGYDWSGVGWNYSMVTQSFGMLSPRHYLVASHFGGASYLEFCGAGGALYTGTQQSTVASGCGPATSTTAAPDVTLGTLTVPIPSSAQVASYPILDLVPSTTATSPYYGNYVYKSCFMYGFTGRVAVNTFTGWGSNYTGYYLVSSATSATSAMMQSGDSGSPSFLPWTDPNGNYRLTLVGHNWAVDSYTATTTNYHALLPANDVAAALNRMMAAQGYALRWVADAASTWRGNTSGTFGDGQNWSARQVPSDIYIAFSGDATNNRTISTSGTAALALRGITFLTATSGKFFTLQTGGTLALGRGGIINYDPNNTQVVACDLILGDAQWWDGGSRGLTVTGSIGNNGATLVLDGSGTTQLSGAISGTGGLAKEGSGILSFTGVGSFSGPVFIHNGALDLAGSMAGTGGLTVETGGTLTGTGQLALSGTNNLRIDGVLSPGNSLTTGTLQVVPATGKLGIGDTGTLVFNAGNHSDLIAMNSGTVALGGTLQIVQGAGFGYTGSYTIFSGLGAAPTGSFSAVTGLDTGFSPSFSTRDGNYILTFAPTTFGRWQQTHFTTAEIDSGLADTTADPDGDGISNLSEYAFGLNPRTAGTAGVPVVSSTAGYLMLTVTKNPNAADLTYTVEATGDLTDASSWTSTDTTVLEETTTTLVVRDNTLMTDAPRRFMRVRVTGT